MTLILPGAVEAKRGTRGREERGGGGLRLNTRGEPRLVRSRQGHAAPCRRPQPRDNSLPRPPPRLPTCEAWHARLIARPTLAPLAQPFLFALAFLCVSVLAIQNTSHSPDWTGDAGTTSLFPSNPSPSLTLPSLSP